MEQGVHLFVRFISIFCLKTQDLPATNLQHAFFARISCSLLTISAVFVLLCAHTMSTDDEEYYSDGGDAIAAKKKRSRGGNSSEMKLNSSKPKVQPNLTPTLTITITLLSSPLLFSSLLFSSLLFSSLLSSRLFSPLPSPILFSSSLLLSSLLFYSLLFPSLFFSSLLGEDGWAPVKSAAAIPSSSRPRNRHSRFRGAGGWVHPKLYNCHLLTLTLTLLL